MNNISWFLYAVDIIENIQKFAVASSILLTILMGIGLLIMPELKSKIARYKRQDRERTDSEQPTYYDEEIEGCSEYYALWGRVLSFCKYTIPLVLILAVFTPVSKTMYLMLGSEVSESVVMSETGQRVQDAINKKLDEYLGEE